MNAFYDISTDQNLPDSNLQLRHLGTQRIFAMTGRSRGSDFWGTRGTDSTTHHTPVVAEDYDNLFASKINGWKPVYDIGKLLEHHYQYFIKTSKREPENYFDHIRYVILPKIRRRESNEAQIELVQKWLNSKDSKAVEQVASKVVNNNTIKFGDVHAPIQFQQNSSHSTQIQNNHYHKEDVKTAFDLLSRDLQNVDAQIRADFELEMDYALKALEKGKDIKPQLLNIGSLVKDVGMGVFTNLAASPIYELMKPYFGL